MLVLDIQKPDHTVKIGKTLPIPLSMKLALYSVDLSMVSHSIVEHRLGIPLGTKLTFQKKRVFAKAR